MPLTLLAGPANSGKVATLLDRYLASIHEDPVLIVPNRPDVDRIERDLLERSPALLGGSIGTFADLFEQLARSDTSARPVAGEAQRALIVRRVLARARLNGLGRSARFQGFSDSLAGTLGELESGLLEPGDLEDEDLAALYRAYREELDRLGLWDRDYERRHAAGRVAGELGAWDGRPVFAYGFEDLTGAEWTLLEGLAARSELTLSLPYEPGRTTFNSLERTAADLASLGRGRIEELPAGPTDWTQPGLAYLERALFVDAPPKAPSLSGELRFFEGAGSRVTHELVGEEILGLLRAGVRAEEIAVVCPSIERVRAPLETAFSTLGIPFAVEGRLRLSQTTFGQALAALLRFVWLEGGRADLYAYLRSPYSGLTRAHVDYLEGRLRGRAVKDGTRVEEETIKLRGKPLPILDQIRSHEPLGRRSHAGRVDAARARTGSTRRRSASVRADLRAYEAVLTAAGRARGLGALGEHLSREEILAALERATVRGSAASEPGRVHVLDLMRARTRRYETVFVLGLEQGSLPRRSRATPFLDDEARAEIDVRKRGARLARPDQVSRDRYLFYTACTRATRRALSRPRGSDRRRLAARSRAVLGRGTRPLAGGRGGALDDAAGRFRRSPGSSSARRPSGSGCARWRRSPPSDPRRPTRWRSQTAGGGGSSGACRVRPADASAASGRARGAPPEDDLWRDRAGGVRRLLLDLVHGAGRRPALDRRRLDARLRGSVAHTALHKFFAGPAQGARHRARRAERLDDALTFLHQCLDEALESGLWLELTDVERSELDQALRRDLEHFVRRPTPSSACPSSHAASRSPSGRERAAPELQAGLDLGGFTLSGKIDRIDVDPFSARGIVQDYKSGKTAFSAAKIESELRLQIPLYMLVLRDLVGIEPLGGLYRALAGERDARGLLRAEAKEDLPGFGRPTTWTRTSSGRQVETGRERATALVERIRDGDVRHDPKGGFPCPSWCELWSMCRVRRAECRPRPRPTRSSSPRSRLRASSSSRQEPGRGRRPCSSSATCARSANAVSTSSRSSSSPTRSGPRVSSPRASARGCSSSAATTSRARWTAPGSRPSTASATGC